jgi:hypothetical protein
MILFGWFQGSRLLLPQAEEEIVGERGDGYTVRPAGLWFCCKVQLQVLVGQVADDRRRVDRAVNQANPRQNDASWPELISMVDCLAQNPSPPSRNRL